LHGRCPWREEPDRLPTQRYADRDWRHEGAGTWSCALPNCRKGSYFPASSIRAAWPRRRGRGDPGRHPGVSTVRSTIWSKSIGMSGISKSQVSRLCEELERSRRGLLSARLTASALFNGSMPPISKSPSGRIVLRRRPIAVRRQYRTAGANSWAGLGCSEAETSGSAPQAGRRPSRCQAGDSMRMTASGRRRRFFMLLAVFAAVIMPSRICRPWLSSRPGRRRLLRDAA